MDAANRRFKEEKSSSEYTRAVLVKTDEGTIAQQKGGASLYWG